MTKEEKAKIYRDRFPAIISERLASQVSIYPDVIDEVNNESSDSDLIINVNNWDDMKEGAFFWDDIDDLYRDGKVTDEQLREVFDKYMVDPDLK